MVKALEDGPTPHPLFLGDKVRAMPFNCLESNLAPRLRGMKQEKLTIHRSPSLRFPELGCGVNEEIRKIMAV